jgi:hypothetical protein
VGTGLGTIFRYFSYKKWVFLAETPGASGEAAVSGVIDPAGDGYGPLQEHLDPADAESVIQNRLASTGRLRGVPGGSPPRGWHLPVQAAGARKGRRGPRHGSE